jgi:CDP-diacylglycerol pyrophosphatase
MGAAISDEAVFAIYERVPEVQALLHDHVECGKHTAEEVLKKVQQIISEDELLRAMYHVGYFRASLKEFDGSSAL